MTNDPDKEIREIADRLPLADRERFLSAINHIRVNSNRGRVRLRPIPKPDDRQQMILDTYMECGKDLRATEAALADQGITYSMIAYATRRFGVRDIKYHKWTAKPDPVVLDYVKQAHADGYTAATVKKELSQHYGRNISELSFRKICEEANVSFVYAQFDMNRMDELLADIRALELKYGVSFDTMRNHFYAWLRNSNAPRERR